MRKTSKKDVTVEQEVVDDIFCDKCGESIHLNTVHDWVQITGGELTFEFNYGSNKDGDTYKVEMCDDCCDEFFKSLKHTPRVIPESLFFTKPTEPTNDA